MKDIDWGKMDRQYTFLVQDTELGYCYTCNNKHLDEYKDRLIVLAERPKPPLTKEQIEIVREFYEWVAPSSAFEDFSLVDQWLEKRGGEHE